MNRLLLVGFFTLTSAACAPDPLIGEWRGGFTCEEVVEMALDIVPDDKGRPTAEALTLSHEVDGVTTSLDFRLTDVDVETGESFHASVLNSDDDVDGDLRLALEGTARLDGTFTERKTGRRCLVGLDRAEP